MNGAEALVETLTRAGVEVCFANPGTSEMQVVAAIDRQPGMRAILGLFEGVVTGAADGYARMAGKPAMTLLHLGPGLANGLANIHNARRARSPMVNIVGDHATGHLHHDSPLTSDTAGVARPMSDWVGTSRSARDLAQAGAEAWAEAMSGPGRIATLIVPADHAWTEGSQPAAPSPPRPLPSVPEAVIAEAAEALRPADGPVALFLGGKALHGAALGHAAAIAAATGAQLISETFAARLERGAGRPQVQRLPYPGEMAAAMLAPYRAIVFCGCEPPVAFFAYPDKPSWLSPDGARLVRLASPREDAPDALARLAERLEAGAATPQLQPAWLPPVEDGPLDAARLGAVVAALIPEDAIVCDEAATAGFALYPLTAGAARHDWLTITGGAIGMGLPFAAGAAVACPERKVLALQADGGGMYTLQALWTMAREQLDVAVVIVNNGSYAILNIELARVGVANPGPKALSMLSLRDPALDWVKLAEGMGVPARRATTSAELREALAEAIAGKGPMLVEAMV